MVTQNTHGWVKNITTWFKDYRIIYECSIKNSSSMSLILLMCLDFIGTCMVVRYLMCTFLVLGIF